MLELSKGTCEWFVIQLDQSAEEILGIPELHSGSLLQSIPGKYRFCSPEIVRESLLTISKLVLYPVTLAPSSTFTNLQEVLLKGKEILFSNMRKELYLV